MAEHVLGPSAQYNPPDIDEDIEVVIQGAVTVRGSGRNVFPGVRRVVFQEHTLTVTPVGLMINNVDQLTPNQTQQFMITGNPGGVTVVGYEWQMATGGDFIVDGQVALTANTEAVTYRASDPDYCIWGSVQCFVTVRNSEGVESEIFLTEEFIILAEHAATLEADLPEYACVQGAAVPMTTTHTVSGATIQSITWETTAGTITPKSTIVGINNIADFHPPSDENETPTITVTATFRRPDGHEFTRVVTQDVRLWRVAITGPDSLTSTAPVTYTAVITPSGFPESVLTYAWFGVANNNEKTYAYRAQRNGSTDIVVQVRTPGSFCEARKPITVSGLANPLALPTSVTAKDVRGLTSPGRRVTTGVFGLIGGNWDSVSYSVALDPVIGSARGPDLSLNSGLPEDTTVTATFTVTVTGEGNRAAEGTLTGTFTTTFEVSASLYLPGSLVAPIINVGFTPTGDYDPDDPGPETRAYRVSEVPRSGRYDTATYEWAIIPPSGAGLIGSGSGPWRVYIPPAGYTSQFVSSQPDQIVYTITIVGTYRGTGDRATDGEEAVGLIAQTTQRAYRIP